MEEAGLKSTDLFLVYGSLRRDHGNHCLLESPGVTYRGQAVTQEPYAVYGTAFPAAVPDATGKPLLGEVYEVLEEAVVAALDWLESNGVFYTRALRPVVFLDGSRAEAWLYECNYRHGPEFNQEGEPYHDFV